MFTDVGVDGAERVVQQVDVPVLVDGARQGYPLLLTPGQVDALKTHRSTTSGSQPVASMDFTTKCLWRCLCFLKST